MAEISGSEDDFFTKKQIDLMNMFETNLQKTLSAINNQKISGVDGEDDQNSDAQKNPDSDAEKIPSPKNDPRISDGYWKSYFRDDNTQNLGAHDSKNGSGKKAEKFIDYGEKHASDSYDTDEKVSNKKLLKFSNNYLKGAERQQSDSEDSEREKSQNFSAKNSDASQDELGLNPKSMQRDFEIKRETWFFSLALWQQGESY